MASPAMRANIQQNESTVNEQKKGEEGGRPTKGLLPEYVCISTRFTGRSHEDKENQLHMLSEYLDLSTGLRYCSQNDVLMFIEDINLVAQITLDSSVIYASDQKRQ